MLAVLAACALGTGCGGSRDLKGPEEAAGTGREEAAAGTGREKAAAGAVSGKGDESGGSRMPERRLKVAATIFPYYDFVRQIAGDLAELKLVVPAGMDSHSFEPTPADMRAIQEADVLIMNGGTMEQWVSRVLEAVDAPELTVVTMMDYADVFEEELVEGMEDAEDGHEHGHEEEAAGTAETDGHGTGHAEETSAGEAAGTAGETDGRGSGHTVEISDGEAAGTAGETDGHEHGHDDGDEIEYDEHIWTSPVAAMRFVQVIADTLAQADPANADAYAAGAARYLEELKAVHEGFLEVSDARKRDMIVVGDKFPFRYLAEEYGLTYRAAFSGCSTDTEPSARTIAYLIGKVREEQIPAVYYLELSSHRVAEIIGEETGAQPLLLHSCHNVTRAELDAGVTYADLMRGNIESLRKGLDE